MGKEQKQKRFFRCEKEIARKKLLLGNSIIGCINITSNGYVKERKDVENVKKFDKISKNYKYFIWAVK